jgi:hypothetical protein
MVYFPEIKMVLLSLRKKNPSVHPITLAPKEHRILGESVVFQFHRIRQTTIHGRAHGRALRGEIC